MGRLTVAHSGSLHFLPRMPGGPTPSLLSSLLGPVSPSHPQAPRTCPPFREAFPDPFLKVAPLSVKTGKENLEASLEEGVANSSHSSRQVPHSMASPRPRASLLWVSKGLVTFGHRPQRCQSHLAMSCPFPSLSHSAVS